jgi:hypothetical protein
MNASIMKTLSTNDSFVWTGPVTGFQLFFQQAGSEPLAANRLWRGMAQEERSEWTAKARALTTTTGKGRHKLSKKPASKNSQSKVKAPKKAKHSIKELRQLLEARGLPTDGKKGELAKRLAAVTGTNQTCVPTKLARCASANGKENAPFPLPKPKAFVHFSEQPVEIGIAEGVSLILEHKVCRRTHISSTGDRV